MSEVDPLLTITQRLNQKNKIKNNDTFHEVKVIPCYEETISKYIGIPKVKFTGKVMPKAIGT